MQILKNIKKGDYFIFPNGKTVYVANGYNRHTRKYGYTKFYDMNAYYEKQGSVLVLVDFPFDF